MKSSACEPSAENGKEDEMETTQKRIGIDPKLRPERSPASFANGFHCVRISLRLSPAVKRWSCFLRQAVSDPEVTGQVLSNGRERADQPQQP